MVPSGVGNGTTATRSMAERETGIHSCTAEDGKRPGVKPPRRSWQQHRKPLLGPIRIVPREVLFFSWGGYLPKTVAPMEPPACLRTWVLAAKSRAVSALLGALSGSTETPGAGLAQRPLEKGRCAEHRAGDPSPTLSRARALFLTRGSPAGLPIPASVPITATGLQGKHPLADRTM